MRSALWDPPLHAAGEAAGDAIIAGYTPEQAAAAGEAAGEAAQAALDDGLSPEAADAAGKAAGDPIIAGKSPEEAAAAGKASRQGGPKRPTFLYFRGSMASDRPGEENYGEGVRQKLEAALSSFQIPSHLRRARSLASAPGIDQEHIVFSSQAVTLPQYLDEMSRSDFCIVPLGSSSWTLRLYDAIFTGCVPVILSDHIALPFDERIDWSELAIKWRQADAERLPTFLLSLSSAQVAAKRKAILAARHNLAWCGTGGAFEQLVVALEERKRGLPRRSKEEALPTSPASFWIEQPGDVDARVRETEHCTPSASWAPRPGRAATNQRTHDVVTIIPRPTCVLRAALQSLETRLQPRKVHLILDSCDGVELALADFRVRCVELDAAVPIFPVEAMTVPPARRYWYRQQLAKLAMASHEEVSETFYMWDGDTIALLDVMPTQMPDGRFPLLWGAPMDSPAHFVQTTGGDYSLPPGYRESTQALIGVAPTPNVSYVTQWQIWHKPFVLEMLGEIEQRTPEGVRWPEAVLAAASDHMQQGFSEYTLYGTWLLARHPQQVQLVSSHDVSWLRDPPSGLLDKAGECCPSSESLCQAFVEVEQLCGPLNDVPEGATLQAITIEIPPSSSLAAQHIGDVAARALWEGISVAVSIVGAI
ncbi:hypothetical protein EMIHUDRAFT_205092 [Emiliania huxleyi CCMP1516]|uniref:Exostosin GT47 domain-containing protein n=2 Tax=Emiliania huxleyi TaxID=2903 RepID=A0A0D3JUG0_EMIH1|nr:hypothetical protein EMIHUDRAFT_205092 [Emiliania huxleyi CCMP1516]EOD27145.1 hypothetical protein EMIHUDRAFT_205092 [Emiliania huxleyi CCMP1516]|eukprot:XP_005779574.1 hypothetical protein EMIHUDRAFT_205092 [Emiliania huxleyi CCMP1516]